MILDFIGAGALAAKKLIDENQETISAVKTGVRNIGAEAGKNYNNWEIAEEIKANKAQAEKSASDRKIQEYYDDTKNRTIQKNTVLNALKPSPLVASIAGAGYVMRDIIDPLEQDTVNKKGAEYLAAIKKREEDQTKKSRLYQSFSGGQTVLSAVALGVSTAENLYHDTINPVVFEGSEEEAKDFVNFQEHLRDVKTRDWATAQTPEQAKASREEWEKEEAIFQRMLDDEKNYGKGFARTSSKNLGKEVSSKAAANNEFFATQISTIEDEFPTIGGLLTAPIRAAKAITGVAPEMIGEGMQNIRDRPIKGTAEVLFGAGMATPVGMAWSAGMEQKPVKPIVEEAFELLGKIKEGNHENFGITNIHAQDSLDLLTDIGTFWLIGRAGKKGFDTAKTGGKVIVSKINNKTVLADKAQIKSALAEITTGQKGNAPRELVAKMQEMMKDNKKNVSQVIRAGKTEFTVPRNLMGDLGKFIETQKMAKGFMNIDIFGKGKNKKSAPKNTETALITAPKKSTPKNKDSHIKSKELSSTPEKKGDNKKISILDNTLEGNIPRTPKQAGDINAKAKEAVQKQDNVFSERLKVFEAAYKKQKSSAPTEKISKEKFLEARKEKNNFLDSKWIKARIKIDDKELLLKKLENLPTVQRGAFDSAYNAEMLKHGRIDTRVEEAFDVGYKIDAEVVEFANNSKIEYKKAEQQLNEYFFSRAMENIASTQKEGVKNLPEYKPSKDFDAGVVAIAKKIDTFLESTNNYLHEKGMINDFGKNQRALTRDKLGYKEENKKFVPTTILENAVFDRVNAIMWRENNKARKELYTLWEQNKENPIFESIFREVKEADLEQFFSTLKKEGEKKLWEMRKISSRKGDITKIETKISNLNKEKGEIFSKITQQVKDGDAIALADIQKKQRKRESAIAAEIKKLEAEKEKISAEEAKAKEKVFENVPTRKSELRKRQDAVRKWRMEFERKLEPEARKELLEYAWAKHTPERNWYHGEGAAGMSTPEAYTIIERIEGGKNFSTLKPFYNELLKKANENLEILYTGKVITKKKYYDTKSIYENHVPLHREWDGGLQEAIGVVDITKKDTNAPIYKAGSSKLSIADLLDNIEGGKHGMLRAHKLAVQKMEIIDIETAINAEKIKVEEGIISENSSKVENGTQKIETLQKEIVEAEKEIENLGKDSDQKILNLKTKALKKLEGEKTHIEAVLKKRREKIADAEYEIAFLKDERKADLERWKNPLNFLKVMEKGELKILEIKEPGIAEAINNTEINDVPLIFEAGNIFANTGKNIWKAGTKGTNIIGRLATTYSPTFAVANSIRDAQTFLINYGSDTGAMKSFKATKTIPENWKVVFDYLGKKDTAETKLYHEFLKEGGTTGGMAMSLMDNLSKNFGALKNIENLGGVEKAKHLPTYLDAIFSDFNSIAENATRFQYYKEKLASGSSKREAALAAKNSTVNFNKKGTWGHNVNQWFLFSNAALQGTKNFYSRSRKDGRWNKKWFTMVAGVLAVNWAMEAYNDIVDPEWRDKLNDYEKGMNFIFGNPFNKIGVFEYLSIPMSLEIASISQFARSTYNTAVHGGSPKEAVYDTVTSFSEAMNIIGQAGTTLQQFSPSIIRPIEQWVQNTSFARQDIVPNIKGAKHEYEKFYPNTANTYTGRQFIGFSKFLYEKTGWDTSPEQWKNLVGGYTAGSGRTIMRITNIAVPDGKDTPIKDIPLLNRFFGSRSGQELENVITRNKSERAEKAKMSWGDALTGGMAGKWQAFIIGNKKGEAEEAIMVRVLDGDTVEVLIGDNLEKIRMFGVDTPETVNSKTLLEEGGIEASSNTKKSFLPGEKIILRKEGEENRGNNGRLLRILEVEGGENYSEILVREGLAESYWNTSEKWAKEKYDDLQEEAKEEKKGVWGNDGNLSKDELEMYIEDIWEMEEQEKKIDTLTGVKKTEVLERIRQRELLAQIEGYSSEVRKLQGKKEKGENVNIQLEVANANLTQALTQWGGAEKKEDLTPYKEKLFKQWFIEQGGGTREEYNQLKKAQFGEKATASEWKSVKKFGKIKEIENIEAEFKKPMWEIFAEKRGEINNDEKFLESLRYGAQNGYLQKDDITRISKQVGAVDEVVQEFVWMDE